MRYLFTFALLCLSLLTFSQNKAYYVDAVIGNDNKNDGSIAQPWKTVSKTNTFNFKGGDVLYFAGGQTFGRLQLTKNDSGVTVKSYNGVATLGGLTASNVGGITIDGLNFRGAGVTGNNDDGIFFYMDSSAATDLENISISNVTVTNFGASGILIGAWGTDKGYNNVKVLNSTLNNNGRDGFATYGYNDLVNHTNLYLYKVQAFRNYGRTDITYTNTGSGIVVGSFDGGLVEYCEAYENGKNNRSYGGGPQGLWCFNSRNIIFQYSTSHHNQAGKTVDGGGFDIDGGSQYCTIQYCYSYNNEGPGFAFFE
ncbi:MAG TPA: hypothetical protein VM187_13525, partial [Niastella sp.]|nr:hypothetical protein [Niastella sp.]